ncbi:hypothetical protein [Serratia proteamaculans]|uniref:hypothetical protein n=1 Tax=Serratia proteamaculans TaxID=28151 RepID=UPI0039AF64D5
MGNLNFEITTIRNDGDVSEIGRKIAFGLTDSDNVKFTGITDNGFKVKNNSEEALVVTIRFVNLNGSKDIKHDYRLDSRHTREVKNPFPKDNSTGAIYNERKCPLSAPMSAYDSLSVTGPDDNAGFAWVLQNTDMNRYIYFACDVKDKIKGDISQFQFVIAPLDRVPIAYPEDDIEIKWYGADFEPD